MYRYVHTVVWSVHETTLNDAATAVRARAVPAVRLRGLCAAATAAAADDDDDGGAMNNNNVLLLLCTKNNNNMQ